MNRHHVIINTTPVGTYPDVDVCAPIPYEHLSSRHYLFDLIYNPAKTLFLKKGEEAGTTIKNGYEMLVIQAEESWRIWSA
jgi:shikimate dehydrogenase